MYRNKAFARRIAIISGGEEITYSEMWRRMDNREPLPIPLLGNDWQGNFRLCTTGTTGRPKEVIVSQKAVWANTMNLIEGQGYSDHIVFIIAGDMTHLGCWSKIFPTLAVGGTLLILPDGMRDIEAFFAALDMPAERFGQQGAVRFATFLVPSHLRMLLQFSGDRLARYADRLDFIETGAAPMPHADMLELCRLLPDTRLYNTYASTETGVVATYNYNDGRCLPGCLGRPLPHSSIFITPEGCIACKGDTLMEGYDGMPLEGGVFVTRDRGYIDEEGMLHIQGREDDIINVGGYKVSPVEVEDAALSHPSVADCLCIARPHALLGQQLVLLVVPAEGCVMDKRMLARHIAAMLERYKVPMLYETVERIARTPNGKPDRKKYRS